MMMAVDIYRPDLWTDFFLMVGGAAAVLSGLVFVAMSINLEFILQDPTHRYRAIGTLAGLTAVFMICALVLMGGQNHQAVGSEWLAVAIIAEVIGIAVYIQSKKRDGSSAGLSTGRMLVGLLCSMAEIIGAIMLILGHATGLYVAASAMVIYVAFLVSGAWLLLIGAYHAEEKQQE